MSSDRVGSHRPAAWVVAVLAATATALIQMAYVLASVLGWASKGLSPVASGWFDLVLALGWTVVGALAAYGSRRAFKAGRTRTELVFASLAVLSVVWMFWPHALDGPRSY